MPPKQDSRAVESGPFQFSDGDVRIIVTVACRTVNGKVSSHALSFASIVWKKCLFPPWHTESTPVEEVDFNEDDSDALLILLNIAHLRFKQVPAALSYTLLLQVAILCDKYDCAKLVRPWLNAWCSEEFTESLKPRQENWLFVAWTFGRRDVFDVLAAHLVLEIRRDSNGDYIDTSGKKIPDPMPPGIMESILTVRYTTIENLLAIAYKELERYANSRNICCLSNEPGCDALIYGSISLGLAKAKLWPQKSAGEIDSRFSVKKLAQKIEKLVIYEYSDPAGGPTWVIFNHLNCSRRALKEAVDEILSGIPSPVLASHRSHMEKQA